MKRIVFVLLLIVICSVRAYSQKVSVGGKAEKSAQFPGGTDSLNAFIDANLRYPQEAIEHQVEGQVIVKCIINDSGEITEPVVVNGLSGECDAEALRLVTSLPRFFPAEYNSEPVFLATQIVVKFVLPKK